LNILDEERISRYFLCQLLSSEDFQYYFISNATSSGGQANISPDLIYNTEIVVPPKEIMQKFHQQAEGIYSKIFANELEIETLSNLRDTLLPKLMKGEIKV
jgi:type I restriction enzyme S subunit